MKLAEAGAGHPSLSQMDTTRADVLQEADLEPDYDEAVPSMAVIEKPEAVPSEDAIDRTDCDTIGPAIEAAENLSKKAKGVHLAHKRRAHLLATAVKQSERATESLVGGLAQRQRSYKTLRSKIETEIAATKLDVKTYRKMRSLAVKYEQSCVNKKTRLCAPGPGGVPECHQVCSTT